MSGAPIMDSVAMSAASGMDRAKEGWQNPALGINPLRDANGDLVIPYNPYADAGNITGLGHGVVGGMIDQISNWFGTIDELFRFIRTESAFTKNPIADVVEGHFLTPFNVNATQGMRIFSGMGDVSLGHVGPGERLAAMSGLHNPNANPQQQH